MEAVLTKYLNCEDDSEGLVSVLLHLTPVETAVMNPHTSDGEVGPHQRHPGVPPDLDPPGSEDPVTFLPEHHRALVLAELGDGTVQLETGANLYLDDSSLANNPVLSPLII